MLLVSQQHSFYGIKYINYPHTDSWPHEPVVCASKSKGCCLCSTMCLVHHCCTVLNDLNKLAIGSQDSCVCAAREMLTSASE